ncbi:hypothetical protein P3T23_004398 [Paraburkholderia sp. GAS448]|uniref:hypothetical protein n=1 Tax=Paraburkholderia sp. GAS448 TaxID=3035136 RepID=UPI003D1BBDD4
MNKIKAPKGSIFRRAMSPQLKAALTSDNVPAWWRAMVSDPELFVAPRDGYLNVYYKGNSLVRLIASSDGQLVGEVHYKYLLRPELANAYWKMTHDGKLGNGDVSNLRLSDFFHDLNDLASLKRASKNFSGVEKSGIAKILARNPNVIDLEVAFGTPPDGGEEKSKIPRIDLIAAHRHEDGVALAFYEAKDYGNVELRSSEPKDVPVLNQMRKYEEEISRRRVEIAEAYRNHCQDLLEILPVSNTSHKGGGDSFSARRELLEFVAYHPEKLYIALQPRLLVFGFDQAQKTHAGWKIHLERLEGGLSESRVIAMGDPAGIRLDGHLPPGTEVWKYQRAEGSALHDASA